MVATRCRELSDPRASDSTCTRFARSGTPGVGADVHFPGSHSSQRRESTEQGGSHEVRAADSSGIDRGSGDDAWEKLSEDDQKQIYADYQAINQTPGVTPNDTRLDSPQTATTVRVEDDKTLTTDGPFVSVKEALGGWLTYEADNLDAAIELAARIPAARMGGAIEIRPVVEG